MAKNTLHGTFFVHFHHTTSLTSLEPEIIIYVLLVTLESLLPRRSSVLVKPLLARTWQHVPYG